MALFVDGPACTIEDLTDHDAGVMAVAQDESIDLATKLRLAQEEIGMELQQWLDRSRPAANVSWGPSLRIEQVVVTPTLRYWQIMLALVLVYRDAYFSQ